MKNYTNDLITNKEISVPRIKVKQQSYGLPSTRRESIAIEDEADSSFFLTAGSPAPNQNIGSSRFKKSTNREHNADETIIGTTQPTTRISTFRNH